MPEYLSIETPARHFLPSLALRDEFFFLPLAISTPSQVFLPRRDDPGAKHGTGQHGINATKRVHDRLQPDLEHVVEELANGLFRLRAGGVVCDRGAAATAGCGRGRGWA